MTAPKIGRTGLAQQQSRLQGAGPPPALLWLDDIRPAPDGWYHARTVDEAIAFLCMNDVQQASLDHDLGACAECLGGKSPEQWLEETAYQSMPHCDHFGTGYTLVCWMEEHGVWPRQKPTVHSRNPVGRARMQQVIEKAWHPTSAPAQADSEHGQ